MLFLTEDDVELNIPLLHSVVHLKTFVTIGFVTIGFNLAMHKSGLLVLDLRSL